MELFSAELNDHLDYEQSRYGCIRAPTRQAGHSMSNFPLFLRPAKAVGFSFERKVDPQVVEQIVPNSKYRSILGLT